MVLTLNSRLFMIIYLNSVVVLVKKKLPATSRELSFTLTDLIKTASKVSKGKNFVADAGKDLGCRNRARSWTRPSPTRDAAPRTIYMD